MQAPRIAHRENMGYLANIKRNIVHLPNLEMFVKYICIWDLRRNNTDGKPWCAKFFPSPGLCGCPRQHSIPILASLFAGWKTFGIKKLFIGENSSHDQ